jgi:ATP-binding cassette, subfamily B, bacterial PglK
MEPSQFHAALILFCLMIVGMILETLGIGMVVPILALISDPQVFIKYSVLKTAIDYIGNPEPLYLVAYGMLVLLLIYTVKVGFLAFLAWKQAHFVFGLNVSISKNLFNNYLHQPYTFHMQRNSAQLIRNVTVEVSQFTTAISAVSLMVAEALVFLGILFLLMVVEPVGAFLVVTTLCLAGLAFYKITRRAVLRWGESRQYHDGQRIQSLQQGLGGVKDVKVLGREDEFSNEYAFHATKSFSLGKNMSVMQALPRLGLELMAVFGLTILVISLLFQGKSMEALVPILGLFAAAAFRLMPSVNRFLVAIQTVRYNMPVIDVLYAERTFLTQNQFSDCSEPMQFDDTLELKNIDFSYPGSSNLSLNNVRVNIKKGSIVGIIGGSGAGKSTLIDLILGLLSPATGQVLVDGVGINTNLRGWQDQIGYVPQSIYLTDDSIRHNIAFGLPESEINEQAILNAVNSAQLSDFVSELPDGLDTIVGERGIRLSGGQLQRIGIARALYHDPQLLVLDEATSALDIDTEREVMQTVITLREEKTVIIVTHRLASVECCDWIYKMDNGQIILAGTPKDVFNLTDRISIA